MHNVCLPVSKSVDVIVAFTWFISGLSPALGKEKAQFFVLEAIDFHFGVHFLFDSLQPHGIINL